MIKLIDSALHIEGNAKTLAIEFGCITAHLRDTFVEAGVDGDEATEVLKQVFDESIGLSEKNDKPVQGKEPKIIRAESAEEALKMIAEFLGGLK